MNKELAPTDALQILDAWQRVHPSRSIETVNNATDGSISAWAVTLEYERGAPPSRAIRYRVIQEVRQPTLTDALVALASLLA